MTGALEDRLLVGWRLILAMYAALVVSSPIVWAMWNVFGDIPGSTSFPDGPPSFTDLGDLAWIPVLPIFVVGVSIPGWAVVVVLLPVMHTAGLRGRAGIYFSSIAFFGVVARVIDLGFFTAELVVFAVVLMAGLGTLTKRRIARAT